MLVTSGVLFTAVRLNARDIADATLLAEVRLEQMAKIVGPEPEIAEPRTPAFLAQARTLLNPGISFARYC